MYSLVIPVYKNEGSLPELLEALEGLNASLQGRLEVVFVVDRSPDQCFRLLAEALPCRKFASQLIEHSRNCGSFAAIRTGLIAATGSCFAVMAADLQEPPELMLSFFNSLAADEADVVIGTRISREDPWMSRLASDAFWFLYRKLVQREIPPGGVDVFGCNETFRRELVGMEEANSSLVGLLMWLGFRRKLFPYARRARQHGKSAWTLGRKLKYLADSAFSFTSLPIRLLLWAGIFGLSLSAVFSGIVVWARLTGAIQVPGYSGEILTICFFGSMNLFTSGIIGSYVWRAFENTKRRPLSVVMNHRRFPKAP